MERFLASVALTLLHSDRLRRRLDFDAVKVQLEATYLLEASAGPDEYSLALELSVASNLNIFNVITFAAFATFDDTVVVLSMHKDNDYGGR